MFGIAVRRLLQAIPVVLLSTAAIFLLLHAIPGDPALVIAGPDASPEVVMAVRHQMGLDEPLPIQYIIWLGHVLRGDLGQSYTSGLPVAELIVQRLPATLELMLAGLLLALLVGIPSGILAAVRQRGVVDWLVSSGNAVAIAIPNFWFGILVIILFAIVLGWLPPGGRVGFTSDPIMAAKSLALPALTLAVNHTAVISRFVKASTLEVLYEDYTRTARAKGLRELVVVRRHVLRNAFIPIATVLGLQFGQLLGGAVVIETVFAWPGVGRLILQAIGNRDYVVVQGSLLMLVIAFIIVNLITDLTYSFLDPRVRLSS